MGATNTDPRPGFVQASKDLDLEWNLLQLVERFKHSAHTIPKVIFSYDCRLDPKWGIAYGKRI